MPTKKQSNPLLKSGAKRMKRGKVSKGKGSVTQSVTVNVLPKSRARTSVASVARTPTRPQFISQPSQAITLADITKLIGEAKKTPTTSEVKAKQPSDEVLKSISVQTEPIKEKSIPINDLLKLIPKVTPQPKLNKSEISEKKNMFQEDLESERLRYMPSKVEPKSEAPFLTKEEQVIAAFERQQSKLDNFNRQISFKSPYEDEYSEVEAIPLAEATVKEKRKYVKSGKYSKKPKPQQIEE